MSERANEGTAGAGPTPADLQADFEHEPNNIDPTDQLRFSWRVEDPTPGAAQTAYHLRVARDRETLEVDEGDCWNSGLVESERSTGIAYDGTALQPNETYYWTVRIRDEDGVLGPDAPIATFSTALASPANWQGDWIGYQPKTGDSNGFRSQWHPEDEDATEWVQFDLEDARDINAVELHPAAPFNHLETPDGSPVSPLFSHRDRSDVRERVNRAYGFGFPNAYRIEVADDSDFKDARVVVDVTDATNPAADSVDHDVDATGRFVRVTATDLYEFDSTSPPNTPGQSQRKPDTLREEMRAWRVFALAGVSIRDSTGIDCSRDCAVSVSSSVETTTWGRDHLVNGATEPVVASSAPLLRTTVDLSKPVAEARAHVVTLGYGEFYVNGDRIGEGVLDPAWTEYSERTLYATHDVTDHLDEGRNAIGFWLGRGRFSRSTRDWLGFGSPRALLQLDVQYEDGTTRQVVSDPSWRATESPIVENDIYDGETYDARREQDGWATPGYDTAAWDNAAQMRGPGGDLCPERVNPMEVLERVSPDWVEERDGGYVIDFGQNLTGWLEVTVRDPDAGESITLHHAEALTDEETLSTTDLRSADATDTYVPRGDRVETYHPRFTYHGFRYARVDGYPGTLDPDDIRACVVSTAFSERGLFDCSDDNLVQLQQNAKWGLRSNTHSIPEDCPQRDERFGWTGDGQITAQALLYNFDAVRFHRKWMDDHDDTQSQHGYVADTVPYGFGTTPADPTWSITRIVVPWYLYQQYGDPAVLECHYEGMRRYVDYWDSVADDHIIGDEYGNYGDWLTFENADGRKGKPFDLFNTSFHYQTTRLFSLAADAVGNKADATRYTSRAEAIKDAFNDAFFDPKSATYASETQSSFAVPLFLGLVPEVHADRVAAGLAEKVRSDGSKLQTGFLGTRPLIHALADYGYPELAYEVVTQPEQPGWMYMVHNGATTMWERWDSDEQVGSGMNSLNHSPFTFVSEFFYTILAGLRFDDTTITDRLTVAPTLIKDLDWVEGRVETPLGMLKSRWETTADGHVFDVAVPWNASARVRLPVDDPNSVRVSAFDTLIWEMRATEDRPAGVTGVTDDGEAVLVDIDAGTYRFTVQRSE